MRGQRWAATPPGNTSCLSVGGLLSKHQDRKLFAVHGQGRKMGVGACPIPATSDLTRRATTPDPIPQQRLGALKTSAAYIALLGFAGTSIVTSPAFAQSGADTAPPLRDRENPGPTIITPELSAPLDQIIDEETTDRVVRPNAGALRSGAIDDLERIGDGDEDVLFEADHVFREDEESPLIAEGNVTAYFGKRYLKADRLIYDEERDIITAEGNVSITDENLETAFAGKVILSGDLRDGLVENFSALLAENARLAADSAVREQGARTRLRKAVYTACSVCTDDDEGKTPTWRIRALRIVRDEERRIVRFRHAFFEVKGVPILYTPFLQAPDPSVERQSGFLTPLVRANSRLGFNIELPYYLAISNSQDATFFPKYTANDGVLWQAEYRLKRDNGYHVVSGGVIDFDNIDPASESSEQGVPGVRWNVFARGHENLTPNLRVGYDVERVSDNTYLRRYNVRRRGDLRREIETSDTNRLRSGIFVDTKLADANVRADTFVFQDLRTVAVCDLTTGERLSVGGTSCNSLAGRDPGVVEAANISDLTPFVLPLVDIRAPLQDFFGGRTTANLNFVSLQRKSGVDTRRVTASANWEREHITKTGHRFKAFGELRGDLFRFADLDEGTEILPGRIGDPTQFEARVSPTIGAEWSYPLTKRTGNARLFIEPRVQLIASLGGRNDPDIINEDSQSIEFDYAGLFDANKSTGFDAIEDGQRVNAGIAASAVFDSGLRLEAAVGQQFRIQSTSAFTPQGILPAGADPFPAGIGEQRSDIVGSLNIRYKRLIGVNNRFRIDDDTGSIQRAESSAFVNLGRLRANANYVRLNEENASAALVRREELTLGARLKLTDNWSTGASWRADLEPQPFEDPPNSGTIVSPEFQTIRQNFSVAYRDDCSLFEVILSRDRTRDIGLGTDNAILFRFTLQSLVD